MTDTKLYSKLHYLKPSLKMEVYDFVDFLLSKQNNEALAKKPKFGCAKGRIKMASDFDATLEDLNEYMY